MLKKHYKKVYDIYDIDDFKIRYRDIGHIYMMTDMPVELYNRFMEFIYVLQDCWNTKNFIKLNKEMNELDIIYEYWKKKSIIIIRKNNIKRDFKNE